MPLRGGYLIVAYCGDGELRILNLGRVIDCRAGWSSSHFNVLVEGVIPTLQLTVMDPT